MTYCPSIEQPQGVTVTPSMGVDSNGCFSINEGEQHTYSLIFSFNNNVQPDWSFGVIKWEGMHEGQKYTVRSSIAVKPGESNYGEGIKIVDQAESSGQLSSEVLILPSGSGGYSNRALGLRKADSTWDFSFEEELYYDYWLYVTPEPSMLSVSAVIREQSINGNHTIGLDIWRCLPDFADCVFLETVYGTDGVIRYDLFDPVNSPNPYTGYDLVIYAPYVETMDGTEPATLTMEIFEFYDTDSNEGNFSVTPSTITEYGTHDLLIEYSNLDLDSTYQGVIEHKNGNGERKGVTLIDITTRPE